MDLLDPIETAVDCGWNIVCAPQIYQIVLEKVRELETERERKWIESRRGPCLRRRIDVEWHAKQQDPILLVFDDWRAFRDHLDELNAAKPDLEAL